MRANSSNQCCPALRYNKTSGEFQLRGLGLEHYSSEETLPGWLAIDETCHVESVTVLNKV